MRVVMGILKTNATSLYPSMFCSLILNELFVFCVSVVGKFCVVWTEKKNHRFCSCYPRVEVIPTYPLGFPPSFLLNVSLTLTWSCLNILKSYMLESECLKHLIKGFQHVWNLLFSWKAKKCCKQFPDSPSNSKKKKTKLLLTTSSIQWLVLR